MIERFCILPFVQILDSFKTEGFVSTFHEIFYLNREAIIIEKDLSSLSTQMSYKMPSNMQFLEISKHNFEEINPKYFFKSRYLKALKNLDDGYSSFAVMKGDEVIGDIWFASITYSRQSTIHSDLKLYEIDIGEKDVYLYDLYTKHEERKNFVGFFLLDAVFHSFRERGFEKVYGYVFADNPPALLIYKEFSLKHLKKVKMRRFLFYEKNISSHLINA
jgi:ribosomal protein S18 acetylase RimI-like enzyme